MVTLHGNPRPVAPGEALFQELLWVHAMLRRDLATVRALAERVAAGEEAPAVQAEIAALETNSALWKFRANCLYYCRFVHHHHTLEDQYVFPAIRHSDPALEPVIVRLEADHRTIAVYLGDVSAAARRLGQADDQARRAALLAALNCLGDDLLAHLTYEEESIGPTLRSWGHWPAG